MTCEVGRVARVASGDGSVVPFWTFDLVVARLVEAQQAWWRCEGGRWPFASDGPWELVRSELYGPEVDKDAPLPRLRLTRAEIARRDQATEWLGPLEDETRRIVVLAVAQLASGRKRVDWTRIRRRMALAIGSRGVGWRFSQAVRSIAQRLDAERVAVD